MYSTRNKAVAAFITYNWGKEAYDHVELFDGQAFLYFNVDRNDPDLRDYLKAFGQITDIINELKPYDQPAPRQARP